MDQNQPTKDIYAPKFEYEPTVQAPSFKEHLIDFIQSVVVIGAIFALIYWQIAQPHKVSGSSMIPTFTNGDYILTDKVTYKLSQPKRGDVVVLKNPRDESQDFIKRIVALPGEKIRVEDGHVFVSDRLMEEDYLKPSIITRSGNFLHEGEEITVEGGHYFVFGDNRTASSDSRDWGPITKDEIVGRVFFRYWPPSVFGRT